METGRGHVDGSTNSYTLARIQAANLSLKHTGTMAAIECNELTTHFA